MWFLYRRDRPSVESVSSMSTSADLSPELLIYCSEPNSTLHEDTAQTVVQQLVLQHFQGAWGATCSLLVKITNEFVRGLQEVRV